MIYAAFYEHVTWKWTRNKWDEACLQRLHKPLQSESDTRTHNRENATAVSFCFAPCWCLLEFHVTKSGTSCHHQILPLPSRRSALLRLDSTLQTWKFLNSTSFDINILSDTFSHSVGLCVFILVYMIIYVHTSTPLQMSTLKPKKWLSVWGGIGCSPPE